MSHTPTDKEMADILKAISQVAKRAAFRSRRTIDHDELFAEGWMVVKRALELYEPTHGASVTTYVVRRAAGAMQDFQRNQDPMSRLARSRLKAAWKEAIASAHETGRQVPACELYESSGVLNLVKVGTVMIDKVTTEQAAPEQAQFKDLLDLLEDKLQPMDFKVLHARFVLEMTQAEVAPIIGMTPSRVTQIERSARVNAKRILRDHKYVEAVTER